MKCFPIHFMIAAVAVSTFGGCDDGARSQEQQDDALDGEGADASPGGDWLQFSAFGTALDGSVAHVDAGLANSTTDDAGPHYGDAELLGIVFAIDHAEIILGRAGQRASDARVQALGTDVASTHEQGRNRALSLDVLPSPSQQAATYLQAGLTLQNVLPNPDSGAGYDDTYLSLQIMLDALVVHQIDTMWLPAATDPEVQAELRATRDATQAHLDRTVGIRTEHHPPRVREHADAGVIESGDQDSGTTVPAEGDEPQTAPSDNVHTPVQPQ